MRTPRTVIGAFLLLGLLLLAGGPLAHAQAITTTTVFKDAVMSYPGMSICNPANTGTATFTYSGVLHTTLLDSGAYHLSGKLVGTLVVVPDNPADPVYTGRLVQSIGPETPVNVNQQSRTATYMARVSVVGSDGSTEQFTYVEHLTVNANGEVTVSFGDVHGVRCG